MLLHLQLAHNIVLQHVGYVLGKQTFSCTPLVTMRKCTFPHVCCCYVSHSVEQPLLQLQQLTQPGCISPTGSLGAWCCYLVLHTQYHIAVYEYSIAHNLRFLIPIGINDRMRLHLPEFQWWQVAMVMISQTV